MSMTGVTDFIVAGPPGHTTAGPPGHVTAGMPGEVRPAPAASVPVSPAGYVPIDTSIARVPIGPGGGGFSWGGSAPGITPASGGANLIQPGGSSPVHSATGGVFTPGGNVPISTTAAGHYTPSGDVRPTPGYFHFTPGGEVRLDPGSTHFTPGGNVPMGLGGSHFMPGGYVPIAPKLGIDPNTPPGRVNPPAPGRVFPHQMSNFQGPRFQHTQSWPKDTFHHTVEVRPWEPKETHPTWQPLEKMDFVLSMDSVDTGALLDLLDSHVPPDPTQPQIVNKSYDFSENMNSQSVNNFTDVNISNVAYNDQHMPTFLFSDNRSNTYILAAPERTSGSLVAQNG